MFCGGQAGGEILWGEGTSGAPVPGCPAAFGELLGGGGAEAEAPTAMRSSYTKFLPWNSGYVCVFLVLGGS